MMQQETEQPNSPEKKFSTGAISAAVWMNTGKGKNGQSEQYRTVSFQRSYKDKNDKWQTSNSLRVHDLPKAMVVLQKAYEYIVLKEGSETPS